MAECKNGFLLSSQKKRKSEEGRDTKRYVGLRPPLLAAELADLIFSLNLIVGGTSQFTDRIQCTDARILT
nr:hypothetical protein Iba_chr10eCG14720 [Ipomoea batatas]